MGLRNILRDDDQTLRKKSRAVTDFNPRLHKLLDDMHDTLIDANGLGLAAPQVGVLRRAVLVVDVNFGVDDETGEPSERIFELINPVIIAESGEQDGSEGCLSMPGLFGMVKRPMEVTVRAEDRYGKTFEVTGTGLTARAFCHEINHLDGVLFYDLASRLLTEEELEEMAAREFDEDFDDAEGE